MGIIEDFERDLAHTKTNVAILEQKLEELKKPTVLCPLEEGKEIALANVSVGGVSLGGTDLRVTGSSPYNYTIILESKKWSREGALERAREFVRVCGGKLD